MVEAVRVLVELGEIDARLAALRAEMESIPLAAEPFRQAVADAESSLDTSAERAKELKLSSDGKNLELRQHEEQIEKLQVQLNAAKSNKEYDITREQMKEIEEKGSALEEEILGALEEIDALDAAESEREAGVAAARAELDAEQREIDARMAELGEEAKDLQARRDDKASRIDSDDLARYQRVFDNWGDTAVATVDVDEGICGACFMRLTKQQLNSVMAGRDIIQCQSCRRILYIGEPVT